jgi:hypothetical protein
LIGSLESAGKFLKWQRHQDLVAFFLRRFMAKVSDSTPGRCDRGETQRSMAGPPAALARFGVLSLSLFREFSAFSAPWR